MRVARGILHWCISVLTFPVSRYHWAAAEDARREQRWDDLARHIEAIHGYYWQNRDTHFLLGCGYARTGRVAEAVDEFRRVELPLSNPMNEQEMRLNLAWCLYALGRPDEASGEISEETISDWRPEYRRRAEEMRAGAHTTSEFLNSTWPIVREASENLDWQTIVERLEPFHRAGSGTDVTHLLMAEACAGLGRWEECLSELDSIDMPLAEEMHRIRSRWTRCLALARTGQPDEYAKELSNLDLSECPDWIKRRLPTEK